MFSPARLAAFLSALIAVVASFGSALAWINTHVSDDVVYVIGLSILVLLYVVSGALTTKVGYSGAIILLLTVVLVVSEFLLAVLSSALVSDAAWGYVMAYGFVALGALPTLWVVHKLDEQSHKQCPDCCERVRAAARVCRYCRYEFGSPPN